MSTQSNRFVLILDYLLRGENADSSIAQLLINRIIQRNSPKVDNMFEIPAHDHLASRNGGNGHVERIRTPLFGEDARLNVRIPQVQHSSIHRPHFRCSSHAAVQLPDPWTCIGDLLCNNDLNHRIEDTLTNSAEEPPAGPRILRVEDSPEDGGFKVNSQASCPCVHILPPLWAISLS